MPVRSNDKDVLHRDDVAFHSYNLEMPVTFRVPSAIRDT
jgi:hypothetical protein